MIKYPFSPKDCSAETLFPEAQRIINTYKPFGYCISHNGNCLEAKTPYWAIELDPLEENKVVGGIVEHDYYIVLCKWMDGTPITYRFFKHDVHPYTKEEGKFYDRYLSRLYNIKGGQ